MSDKNFIIEPSAHSAELERILGPAAEKVRELGLPDFIVGTAVTEAIEYILNGRPEGPGRPFLDVAIDIWENGDFPFVGFGGSMLRYRVNPHGGDECPELYRPVYDWMNKFGDCIVNVPINGHVGIPAMTGGGRGSIPMEGLLSCVQGALEKNPESKSWAGAVLSGLLDEPFTDKCDPRFVVRRQPNTVTREMGLLGLGLGGILALDGYLGTLAEIALALFNAYVSGRSTISVPFKVPIVVVSMPNLREDGSNRNQRTVLGNKYTLKSKGQGACMYSPIDWLLQNMESHGMTKAQASAMFHLIEVTDDSGPEKVAGWFASHQREVRKEFGKTS